MIDKETIVELVKEKLTEDQFLVDVSVSNRNVIHVEFDNYHGLTIDDCVAMSRHVEGRLDRESEDFELQVSSPGIDQPFKVKEQYKRNTGRMVEVTLCSNIKYKGLLIEVNDKGIALETTTREKPDGEKKKKEVTRKLDIAWEDILKTKLIISFK